MGCCGEKLPNSTKDFIIEVLNINKYSSNEKDKAKFIIEKKGQEEFLKIEAKKLLSYFEQSPIFSLLGDNFEFSINNPLFFCYFEKLPVIKNYLQINDLIPFNYENLWKISILNTENFNDLELPMIYLLQETKFLKELENTEINFNEIYKYLEEIKNPELTINSNISSNKNDFESYNDEENENKSTNFINGINKNDKNEYFYYISEDINYHTIKKIYKKFKENKGILELKKAKNQKYLFLKKDEINIVNDINLNDKNKNININEKFLPEIEDDNSSVEGKEIDDIAENNIQITSKNINNNYQNKNLNQNNNINNKENSEIKKNNYITSIFLDDINTIDYESLNALTEILIDYPFLYKFGFYNSRLEKDNSNKIWEFLLKVINSNYNIRYIDLHDSNINDNIVESLCLILEDKRIRYLNLSDNYITIRGALYISNYLKKNKTLQDLILNNNEMKDFKNDGIEYICNSLIAHPNIQAISFNNMILTGCGKAVGELIKNTKSLVNINLKSCNLNSNDFKNICFALSGNISKTIHNINLSFNDMGGNKSIEEIGKMIKVNKTLTYLNLNKMNINMDNYQLIFNSLNENKIIKNFFFSYNPKMKPIILLEYFFYRKDLNLLVYIPYKESINEKSEKIEFNLDEKKLIQKFKNERKDVKLIIK